MKKATLYLLISMCLCGFGVLVLMLGAQQIVSELVVIEENIESSQTIQIESTLDSLINNKGVYVIDSTNFVENVLKIILYDPSKNILINKFVSVVPLEEEFQIKQDGIFTLEIQNTGQQQIHVLSILTHYPDNEKLSISAIGLILLIGGLASLVVSIIILIRNSRKKLV